MTLSLLRPVVRVASRAVRRLRTQLVSPKVPITHRPPWSSTSAIGVVRGIPDFRPRTVMRAFGPRSAPTLSTRRAMGLKSRTNEGALVGDAILIHYLTNQSVA